MNNKSSTGDRKEITTELLQDLKVTAEEATNVAGVGMFQVKLVILSGFVLMAHGFETVIVRFVTPLLACTWNLKRWQGALLSTVTSVSTILGCFLYGVWSDKYGRRTAISSSLTFLFVFGAVSAGMPNFTWFAVFRAVASFSVGGFSQTLVLCCEFFPSNNRGRALYVLACFWALGVVIMLWVFYSTMENEESWRLFVAIGTLPAFLAMCLMRFFPESFRYLMVIDKYFAANDILSEMTETNGKKVTAQLLPLSPMRRRRLVLDFFRLPFVRSSILLWLMGLSTSISFLGLEALTLRLIPKVMAYDTTGPTESTMHFMGSMYKRISCTKSMSQEEFINIVWTTALDFPAFVIYMILVDVFNRKILLFVSYILSSFFIFLLYIPDAENIFMLYVVFVYCARTLLLGQFYLILLAVVETFPTSHRGTAVGFEVATFYIGQFLSSYINEGLLPNETMYYFILYGVLTFLCSLACLGLEQETRGQELQDIIEEHSGENLAEPIEESDEALSAHQGPRTTSLYIP